MGSRPPRSQAGSWNDSGPADRLAKAATPAPFSGRSHFGVRLADDLARLQQALAARYAVDRAVGSGGMATVYLGHDRKHDRTIAKDGRTE